MKPNKNCCRIFPLILIFISAILSAGIWYFDENVHRLTFLTNPGEIVNFLGTVLFVAVMPIGLFYYLNDKEKYQNKARLLSLLGFLPALFLLIILI